jgi:hypothetical protein
MTTQAYQKLIIEGIKGLPPETLVEIVDFIYFVRKRVLEPQIHEAELENVLLKAELKLLNRNEALHLEQEFEDYEQQYPQE